MIPQTVCSLKQYTIKFTVVTIPTTVYVISVRQALAGDEQFPFQKVSRRPQGRRVGGVAAHISGMNGSDTGLRRKARQFASSFPAPASMKSVLFAVK